MNAEFKLNRGEYLEFINLAYARMYRIGNASKKMFAVNLVIWIFIGMGFAGVIRFYELYEGIDFKHLNLSLAFWSIGLTGFIAATIYKRKFYIYYSLNENGRTLQQQKVTLTEENIRFLTAVSDHSYSWSAIQDKEYSKSLICLYIDNNQALLIPKRAFDEQSKLQKFIDFIDDKISSNIQVNEDVPRE